MGIRDDGEWKHYAIERFKSILYLTVRSSLKTRSPIPDWAASKVTESWNVTISDIAVGDEVPQPAAASAPITPDRSAR